MKGYKLIVVIPTLSIVIIGIIMSLISSFSYYDTSLNTYKSHQNELLSYKKKALKAEVYSVVHYIVTIKNQPDINDTQKTDAIVSYVKRLNTFGGSYIFLYAVDLKAYTAETLEVPKSQKRNVGMIIDLKAKENSYWYSLIEKLLFQTNYMFEEYSFINPKTEKVENKLSFFYFDKETNLFFGKGIYLNDFYRDLKKEKDKIIDHLVDEVLNYFFIACLFLLFSSFFSFKLFRKVSRDAHENQEKLKSLNLELEKRVKVRTEEITKKYYFCDLTGLPNRNSLIRDLKKLKALILVDIDDFGAVNDTYGIDFGNYILKEFSRELKSFVNDAIVYRVGSDEFAVGYEKDVFLEDKTAHILRVSKMTEFIQDSVLINIDITLGASREKEALFRTADLALRHGKTKKISSVIYNEELDLLGKTKEMLTVVQVIKDAIKEDRVKPFFQCIVDRDKKIVKYESLMRIIEGNKVISPFYFLEVSKKVKLYSTLTETIIEKSFNYFYHKKMTFTINLSYEDIGNDADRSTLLESIKRYKNREQLVIELVESESVKNFEIVREFVKEIKRLGVKLAIDDFGSGYSNFVYLTLLQPDYIKIDGSIVKNIDTDKNSQLIMKMIIGFAKENKIKVVAEFVHNETIFEIAKELGVDEFQGYYFCEPKPDLIDTLTIQKDTDER